MSKFHTVAVAGASGKTVGPFITEELVKANKKVKVLTRSAEAVSASLKQSPNVEVVVIDYSNLEALTKALHGVDAVFSTVGGVGLLESQLNLIKAAKDAGVKRFYPSEYGADIAVAKPEEFVLNSAKIQIRKALEASGLEYTYIVTGFFHSLVAPYFGFDFANGKVSIVGDGNVRTSWSSFEDIGRAVAESLELPQSKNATLYIDSDVLTFNEIVHLYEKKNGKKYEITYTPLEEAKKKVDTSFNTLVLQLHILAAEEKVLNIKSSNYLFNFKKHHLAQ